MTTKTGPVIIEAPAYRTLPGAAPALAFPQFASLLNPERSGWFAKVGIGTLVASVSRLDGEAVWTVDSLIGDMGVQWANGAGSRSGLTQTLNADIGEALDSKIGTRQ